MRTMEDWQLLQSYAQDRSETAFAELVRRHIDWVYSIALRQTGHSQLAEDVTQSVFALLARNSFQSVTALDLAGTAPSALPTFAFSARSASLL